MGQLVYLIGGLITELVLGSICYSRAKRAKNLHAAEWAVFGVVLPLFVVFILRPTQLGIPVGLAWCVACGVICYGQAKKKNRNAEGWAVLGVVLSSLAITIILGLETKRHSALEQPKTETKPLVQVTNSAPDSVPLREFEDGVRSYRPAVPGTYDFAEREREFEALKALAQVLIRTGDASMVVSLTGLKGEMRNADGYLRGIIEEVIEALQTKQDRTA